MLFNSLHFLIFFPIITAIYFLLPVKFRRIFLLAASWYFYMAWKPEYILLLAFSTSADYWLAIQMGKAKSLIKRKIFLFSSLGINLTILLGFKYFNFFNHNVSRALSNFNIFYDSTFFELLLPVGISFYTFQTMSYAIDVYKKRIKPERNYVKFALFVSFFPQLVAGPIERASHLLPQLEKKFSFDYKRISDGLKLVFWGFFQKVVIADNMSRFVEAVYSKPNDYANLDIILGTLFFSVQIYCDFSGYTDIARGTAKIMGYDLQPNFKRPYFAKSISDFWRRWHISLSTWFRDYIYLPLGGNRVGGLRLYFNVLATFVLSGIWHGARWSFIIWGFIHSIYYIIEHKFKLNKPFLKKQNRIAKIFSNTGRTLFIFILVNFSWIFFRAESVKIAITLIQNLFDFSVVKISFDRPSILLNLVLIAFLLFIHLLERKDTIVNIVSKKNPILRWSIYYIMIILLFVLGNFNNDEFIYFQF